MTEKMPIKKLLLSMANPGIVLVLGVLSGCATTPTEIVDKSATRADPPARATAPVVAAQQRCLALAMYWEARGEGRHGMVAVGSVVLNRVADRRFPNNACDVVFQGGETPPCQFSWWCDGKSDRPTHQGLWRTSLTLANELLTDPPGDPTQGALFFHSTSIKPPWKRTRVAHIGNHVFYR